MWKIYKFFSKNNKGLLFIFLESVALIFIIQTHNFHRGSYINSANAISGSILKRTHKLSNYLSLDKQNKDLVKENENLKNLLSKQTNEVRNLTTKDTLIKYEYITAQVISNPYTGLNNILTLDKGKKDGVNTDMGVVLPNGIVGITLNVSEHYSTVLSILNVQSKINAKVKKNHHYGSLQWDGDNFQHTKLEDLPIQANIKIGDTIISGGKSIIFPEGIPIGYISDFSLGKKSYESISVKFFSDLSALHRVYIVENNLKDEQQSLENLSKNE